MIWRVIGTLIKGLAGLSVKAGPSRNLHVVGFMRCPQNALRNTAAIFKRHAGGQIFYRCRRRGRVETDRPTRPAPHTYSAIKTCLKKLTTGYESTYNFINPVIGPNRYTGNIFVKSPVDVAEIDLDTVVMPLGIEVVRCSCELLRSYCRL